MSFNANLVEQSPVVNEGSNPKNGFTKVAEQPVVRKIPGLNSYNPQTGEHETSVEWKDREAIKTKEKVAAEPKKADKKEAPASEKTRHQEWKEKQQSKQEAREETRTNKQLQKQALAKQYIQEGNLLKASEALGFTSVADFIAATQNAALAIPTKPKELTAEEKKAQQREQHDQAVQAELEESRRFRYETTANNWTRENIVPVMADTEKYQLINQNKDNVPKIQRAVYEYLNKHYNETCQYDSAGKLIKDGEVLNVADVLDTIEAQYEEAATQSLQQFRNVKKFSKFFTKEELAEQEAKEKQTKSSKMDARLPPPVEEEEETSMEEQDPQLGEEETDEDLSAAPRFSVRPSGKSFSNKPFALLSPEEKIAFLRSQSKR